MKNLLFVTSSLFGQDSKSTQIASEFVSSWKAANGPARIIHRDLGSVPHLTAEHFGGSADAAIAVPTTAPATTPAATAPAVPTLL